MKIEQTFRELLAHHPDLKELRPTQKAAIIAAAKELDGESSQNTFNPLKENNP